ncbi:hypothetical protein [Noviherbaspirillum sp. UKPF54]|uniref:hypothetical protein n=1 Tax=Noviherbaspirillum sp. UKPF54 TaxID=2601898 RepID=UPI0011B1490B|nr:hypothetical protein [Noviherbaspirillum sp. UKPF54]QDZ29241.1 hypothetical protein FAY22_15480 [Noviherbaspirillum sp. UKPF54]
MKKSLITSLVSASLLSLSSMAFAAEPVQLTNAQMDGVTAGLLNFNIVQLTQAISAPVAAISIVGGGALAVSRNNNVALIRQRN